MKVLLIDTSEEKEGILSKAIQLCSDRMKEYGVEAEIVQASDVHPCTSCGKCLKRRRCLFDGVVNRILDQADSFDGMIIGSDVMYGEISKQAKNFMDCLFRSGNEKYIDKIGACIVYDRKGNGMHAYNTLNHYFSYSCMPVITGRYFNTVSEMSEQDQNEMDSLAYHMSLFLKGEKKKKDDIPDKLVDFMRGR